MGWQENGFESDHFLLRSPCSECHLSNRWPRIVEGIQTDFVQANLPTREAFP